jgi:hypothetical protein
LYMPVATNGFRNSTIVLLAVTAISAWVMWVCCVNIFGWNLECVFLFILAFHCTVIDLMYWGWTWWTSTRNSQMFDVVKAEVVLHSQLHNVDIKAVVIEK